MLGNSKKRSRNQQGEQKPANPHYIKINQRNNSDKINPFDAITALRVA